MVGSVRAGYRGAPEPMAEYNASVDVDACRAVFAAAWEVTIAPLDVTHSLFLQDTAYQRVLSARSDPLVDCVLETYREWLDNAGRPELIDRRSTTLHDCVAVYLAHDESLVEIEELPLAMDDEGIMRVEDGAPIVRVATGWRDQDAFVEHLVTRLTAGT
jgi:inosine-uridine nucleoside N-ribohydrolase